ncbi:PspC domain-containing protein [Metabacillus fastidiosus]|uniref:PspC domain-containing protein n=1 Tax=Metabacillus fastidiosus TaxID=1458 RepID=UPI003D29DC9E
MKKKLYRSRTDRKLAGILGGLADYFGIDATILRIVFIVALFATSFLPLPLVYIVMAFVVPNEEDVIKSD